MLQRLQVGDDAVVIEDAALGFVQSRQQRLLQLTQSEQEFTCITVPQTSKNRLTAPPSAAAPPATLSSRDRSIADYS